MRLRSRQFLPITATVLLGYSTLTQAGVFTSLKSEAGVWQTGIDGDALGYTAGVDLGYRRNKVILGAGLSSGWYAISSKSVDVGRSDADVTMAYRVIDSTAVFLGFKRTTIHYEKRDPNSSMVIYDESVNTVGLGFSMARPMNSRWALATTASLNLPQSAYQSISQTVTGDGFGFSTEVGLSYRVGRHSHIGSAVKLQSMTLSYANTESQWTTNLLKVGLSYNHNF